MSLHSYTHAAYPLKETSEGYTFTTDKGEEYLLYYSPADGYFPGLKVSQYATMFGFTRPKVALKDEDKTPKDPRIKATILKEIGRFLDDDRNVLVYVCQTTKKRSAAARHKLFGDWFEEIDEPRLIHRVVNEADELYASIVYAQTSPFAQELEENLPTMEEKIEHIEKQIVDEQASQAR
jgi:hypothetical protein